MLIATVTMTAEGVVPYTHSEPNSDNAPNTERTSDVGVHVPVRFTDSLHIASQFWYE